MNLNFLRGELADREWKDAVKAADAVPADAITNLEVEFVNTKRGDKGRRIQIAATDKRGARFNSGMNADTEEGYTNAIRALGRFAKGVAQR